jgi:hypothetical protein
MPGSRGRDEVDDVEGDEGLGNFDPHSIGCSTFRNVDFQK